MTKSRRIRLLLEENPGKYSATTAAIKLGCSPTLVSRIAYARGLELHKKRQTSSRMMKRVDKLIKDIDAARTTAA